MLAQSRRRWANIELALVRRLVLAVHLRGPIPPIKHVDTSVVIAAQTCFSDTSLQIKAVTVYFLSRFR